MADTGWVDPGTVASATRSGSGSGTTWTNPSDAVSENATCSYCTIPKNAYSDWLRASNYDFASAGLESGDTINGIECRYKRASTSASAGVRTSALYLHVSGTESGNNKSNSTEWTKNSSPCANVTWGATEGGPTDVWGTSYSASDILGSGFGVEISANVQGIATMTAHIDAIQLKIYYTEAGGGGDAMPMAMDTYRRRKI